ncbi:ribosomal RNA small subunit methyltransferase A [Puniceicoccales bacterium CK1056]|uniref:Ribosomal RNA small subunit methyltransferase A n=1 Tax=Oceanipulchritudo coccoides TaxID=2706888 RepID=A0A6B2LZ68_9BACT|nr:16S rRNA (adenine(1518)-N(6)/adenine(1519)-N(6))-dimethyltransferase RsmA [Oceanipulchritudo coccoides]NDV62011.1 ribosomal RNA small subunit methyltransferase A [Oceanipulchritudo coccoides]
MPLTPSATRALLESLGHRPRKPLGQNFLIDGNIVRKSLQLAGLQAGETAIEIGPGLGTLSRAMLELGCTVYSIELDSSLSGHLSDTLSKEFPGTFHLLEGDAVKHPRAGTPESTANLKVVANLPYAITTPWLEGMLEVPLPSDMVLMMQKEAADRITAQPGSKAYGAISIFIGAAYERAGVHKVSRACFYPVPGVDSLLLHLRKKDKPVLFSEPARELIRQLFTQRRKQIGSLLQKREDLHPWLEMLPEYGRDRTTRPEAIPLEAWLALDGLGSN